MLKFTDGMTFDTSGPYRVTARSDGYYVVGNGLLCPVASAAEGRAMVAQLQKAKPRPNTLVEEEPPAVIPIRMKKE